MQVKDARAALDALRDEHREKLRREAEMAERQRQHQMAQKLDIMRKKKQEYLQVQSYSIQSELNLFGTDYTLQMSLSWWFIAC